MEGTNGEREEEGERRRTCMEGQLKLRAIWGVIWKPKTVEVPYNICMKVL